MSSRLTLNLGLTQPGLGTGGGAVVVAGRSPDRLVKACTEGFQEPSDPPGKGCLGAWLDFTGSVSVAGFIKLLLPFPQKCKAVWWVGWAVRSELCRQKGRKGQEWVSWGGIPFVSRAQLLKGWAVTPACRGSDPSSTPASCFVELRLEPR